VKSITLALAASAILAAPLPAPAQDTPPAAAPAQPAPAGQRARSTGRTEKLELGTTVITGNRELPKVMYVVPWKHPEAGELRGKPLQSLVEEVLAPVDREVFNREVSYFHALQSGRDAGVETSVTAGKATP